MLSGRECAGISGTLDRKDMIVAHQHSDQSGDEPGGPSNSQDDAMRLVGTVHHLEFWVPSLQRAIVSWGWLLPELGYQSADEWTVGRSWSLATSYIVLEEPSAQSLEQYDRMRPGLNHLALHAGDRASVDRLVTLAPTHGWRLMFGDSHPHAGGPTHYAAYLEDRDGFEVELVAYKDTR
jgi:catechol 2,3-dioxygenase-like lactoylglutathione lyase family enzyme